jgi:hypothetical protein
MNVRRLFLAAVAGTIAYFAVGGIVFGALPFLRNEFAKYPAVYRTQESMKAVMPLGMGAMFVAILVMAALYAMALRGAGSLIEGLRFGALIGVFAVCAFVIHNHVNLNVGAALTAWQGLAYFVEWSIVGAAIGLVYRPVSLERT